MTTYEWRYNTRDRVWLLYIPGRQNPIYNVASSREPSVIETTRIVRRLSAYFPDLWQMARAA